MSEGKFEEAYEKISKRHKELAKYKVYRLGDYIFSLPLGRTPFGDAEFINNIENLEMSCGIEPDVLLALYGCPEWKEYITLNWSLNYIHDLSMRRASYEMAMKGREGLI